MLTLNLTPLFKARGIAKPFTFLVKGGFTAHSANNLINIKTRIVKLEHIEKLCHLLNCEPNDLLLWTPEHDVNYAASHPLQKLNQEDISSNLQAALASIPFKHLKEISKDILNK